MKKKYGKDRNAVNMIEEASHVLQKISLRTLFFYYLGTMPFLLGLLYFWNDMSKNAFANEYCIAASFGLACLFIWMKVWQSVFSTEVYEHISRIRSSPVTFYSIIRRIFVQTVFQTSSIIVLPIAMLITIPFAWAFSTYQLVLVQDYSEKVRIRKLIRENLDTAHHYSFLNHIAILIFSGFGIFVLFNIAIILYVFPFLTKTLFGMESIFSMGGFNILNTTFIFTAVCITHLCVDPLVKILFILEKFYYNSKETGDDLLSDLNTIKRYSKNVIVFLLFSLFCFIPESGVAAISDEIEHMSQQQSLQKNISGNNILQEFKVDAAELDKSIEQVMKRREYTWRMPREEKAEQKEETGFFYNIIKWVVEASSKLAKTIGSWIEAFFEWIASLFPEKEGQFDMPKPKTGISPQTLFFCFVIIVLIISAWIIYKVRLARRENEEDTQEASAPLPDVSDEGILADTLASDKWIELARELMEKGDLRLALRALYLGTLAFLADNNFITIAGYKSNNEYQRELSRRAHTHKDMIEDFTTTVRAVDSIWYGMHEIDRAIFDKFFKIQQRIIRLAQ